MGQSRKKRYQSKGNLYPKIRMTGRSRLLHWEESYHAELLTGDVLFYLHADTAGHEKDDPNYDTIGGSGYLKAMVYDGKEWQLLVMDDLFPKREHHFHKAELPLDTFAVCMEIIAGFEGQLLQRGYRSHYEPIEEEVETSGSGSSNKK